MFQTFNLKIFTLCILNNILQGETESPSHSGPSSTVRFINFVKHSFHYLNASRISNKLFAINSDECGFECVQASTCVSVNMASSSDDNKLFWCEILASDKYISSKSFQQNATSHHFSIMVSREYF